MTSELSPLPSSFLGCSPSPPPLPPPPPATNAPSAAGSLPNILPSLPNNLNIAGGQFQFPHPSPKESKKSQMGESKEKRERRLARNRESARQSRRRKKDCYLILVDVLIYFLWLSLKDDSFFTKAKEKRSKVSIIFIIFNFLFFYISNISVIFWMEQTGKGTGRVGSKHVDERDFPLLFNLPFCSQ